MLFRSIILISTGLFFYSQVLCQTLGTVSYDYNSTSDGYVLYSPTGYTDSYLVDNCGRAINHWQGALTNGNAFYLDTLGNLVKTIDDGNTQYIDGGGSFDRIIKQAWDGTITWNYSYGDSESRGHHDFIPLPNGNVILLVWERKYYSDCISVGRDTSTMTDTVIWAETLVEIQPTGLTTGNVVWKWDIFDHLIQDFDNTKSNFGVVADHPELMNANVLGTGNNAGLADWLHANSIQYVEEFDQIVISLRKISEAIVIDHSTTTNEAASHAGGTYGKGGDILYRIGNPENYDHGTSTDKLLFRQHDCVIFPSGGNYYMSVFNNGNDRPTQYSSVDLIQLPMNPDGSYQYTTGTAYAPSSYAYSYTTPTPTDFFANRTSGAQFLENGNLIVCHGPQGYFFEVDTATNTRVWEYYNPVDVNGPNQDGTDPATLQNNVFKVRKYSPSFSGFVGKTLNPGNYVELNSLNTCNLSIDDSKINSNLKIYPNPFENQILIDGIQGKIDFEILDLSGRTVLVGTTQGKINASELKAGTYLLRFNNTSQIVLKY